MFICQGLCHGPVLDADDGPEFIPFDVRQDDLADRPLSVEIIRDDGCFFGVFQNNRHPLTGLHDLGREPVIPAAIGVFLSVSTPVGPARPADAHGKERDVHESLGAAIGALSHLLADAAHVHGETVQHVRRAGEQGRGQPVPRKPAPARMFLIQAGRELLIQLHSIGPEIAGPSLRGIWTDQSVLPSGVVPTSSITSRVAVFGGVSPLSLLPATMPHVPSARLSSSTRPATA